MQRNDIELRRVDLVLICAAVASLSIARQLPLSPMCVFAIRIEHALNVAVQRPHECAQTLLGRRAPRPGSRPPSLPAIRGFMIGFRNFRDVIAGVLQRDEQAPAGQWYRVFELTLPATVVHDIVLRHLYIQKLGFLSDMRMPSCTITFPSLDLDENPRIRISLV
jgi:hypothetical protein